MSGQRKESVARDADDGGARIPCPQCGKENRPGWIAKHGRCYVCNTDLELVARTL